MTARARQTRGAQLRPDGTQFSLYSSVAEAIELCFFDASGQETARQALTADGDVWSVFVPDCAAGQHYGYRVHGPYDPAAGLRCNPNKLLIDPWARQLHGELTWHDAVTGYSGDDPLHDAPCEIDSAPFVPKSVVTGHDDSWATARPRIDWRDAVIYELNVRGYTMRHPALSAAERGRFAGLSNGQILDRLRALGVTSVELLPVHAFVDERFLHDRGLRNYWGYNSASFFAPAGRYAGADPVGEFRDMVNAIHDAGLEVILDVVYNHTAETDEYGPTVSFRGLDNLAYYRAEQGAPHLYVNDTGCGNTLNADHPEVQAMVVGSLEYWCREMGVDGFRFDLAPVLGRHANGFSPAHPLLQAIENSAVLKDARLIAEPWDIGPGGYQSGNFSSRWAEWNDTYRDAVRRFWRGDSGAAGEFAQAVHGSADRFGHKGPWASVNFVTAHDGFTLTDTVSYNERHNEANGEGNRDGHAHNYSFNCGYEGATDNASIAALRRQQRINMLATLLVSGGTPMLLGGDELGHTQQGNNNAYCQDNELTWLDWSAADTGFRDEIAGWLELRRNQPLLRPEQYRHGDEVAGQPDIRWWHPDGRVMADADWAAVRALALIYRGVDSDATEQLAVLFNPADDPTTFALPDEYWQRLRATADVSCKSNRVELAARSLAVFKSVSG